MGEHIDLRSRDRKKKKERDAGNRASRVSFKRYLLDIQEELLDDEFADDLIDLNEDLNENANADADLDLNKSNS